MNTQIRDLFYHTFSSEIENITPIVANGSSREYFRLSNKDITCIAAYNKDKKENLAFVDYANQLYEKGIRVPKVYAQDLDNDIYLIEDFGDTTLFDMIQLEQKQELSTERLDQMYQKVIKALPKIQIVGGKGFDYTNAYPRKAFDAQSIGWDLNYFKYYFLKLSGSAFGEQELENDFKTLTSFLLQTQTDYFLFRDFQSRNIMIVNNEPAFIDFQGGRRGALQYDLASLLYDGKANLSPENRQRYLNLYIEELSKYINVNEKEFREYYYAYVYVRIMQAMGTYGFRGYFERKEYFLQSIPFALKNLQWLEDNVSLPIKLPALHLLFKQMIHSDKLLSIAKTKLTVNIRSFSYKKGYPQDLSGNGGGFVFDCRAIHNPGRYDKYKSMNGMDKEVKDFLEQQPDTNEFFSHVYSLVKQSVNTYKKRNFTSLMVCFGCTGGRHRSVYFAERLASVLSQETDIDIVLKHEEEKNIK